MPEPTRQDLEDLRQELLEEADYELRHNEYLRSDPVKFGKHYVHELEQFQTTYSHFKTLCDSHGHLIDTFIPKDKPC